MAAPQFLALVVLFIGADAMATPPQLYRQAAYESPVRGAPDDLLLLAGYGFSADDTVVYRTVANSTKPLATPKRVPTHSDAEFGVAPIVSAADLPYSLTIRLPQNLRADQTYALWVHTARGEWSKAVRINDARPLWISPAFVYASEMPASLPRELKIVGRNLQPSPGHATLIRLLGPQHFTGKAIADTRSSDPLNDYVARATVVGDRDPTILQERPEGRGVPTPEAHVVAALRQLRGRRMTSMPSTQNGDSHCASIRALRFDRCYEHILYKSSIRLETRTTREINCDPAGRRVGNMTWSRDT